MKWTLLIQQKLKLAVLLGVIMAVVISFNLILQKNISDINTSVNSIYKDRLIPAADLFRLSENLHSRQLAMEHFLYKPGSDISALNKELSENDLRIWSLISKYEKTYLVERETGFLTALKQGVRRYGAIEKQILLMSSESKTAGLKFYEEQGRLALRESLHHLADLSSIQSEVGTELVKGTRGIVSISNFLSDIQLAIAVVIGLMIVSIIASSRMVAKSEPNFRWN